MRHETQEGARAGAQGTTSQPQDRSPRRSRRAGAVWVAYVVLFVLSVPWYFPAGNGEPLVLGFPLWCFVSLGCYVLAALLTAWRLDVLWDASLSSDEPQGSTQ